MSKAPAFPTLGCFLVWHVRSVLWDIGCVEVDFLSVDFFGGLAWRSAGDLAAACSLFGWICRLALSSCSLITEWTGTFTGVPSCFNFDTNVRPPIVHVLWIIYSFILFLFFWPILH